MRNCTNSSSSSAICRLDWRPSSWSQCAGIALTALALLSLWLSELAAVPALSATMLLLLRGVWQWQRERAAEAFAVSIPWDRQRAVTVAGVEVSDFRVEWRGSLALLRWRSRGCRRWQGRLWWPDLLPPPARRELRLAMNARTAAVTAPPVAS